MTPAPRSGSGRNTPRGGGRSAGGPAGGKGQMNTMVGLVYESLGSNTNDTGVASAAALILFVIILLVTLFNNQVIKKHVHY